MAPFSAVNTALVAPEQSGTGDEQTPTTPKPRFAEEATKPIAVEESSPNTPTGDNFGGVPGQKPLPGGSATSAATHDKPKESDGSLKRDGSYRLNDPCEVHDVEMGDGEDDDIQEEDDGSDNDSITSDSQRPSKKKKGQRFFCTDFPPCQLSFTRSEHLARHIRKHTGERPFQCHCSRRFSRLDNLRQHAQTVHVNEEIPGDSLAATSTRFQRQIRTDRVRPPNNRSRASTIGGQGGHGRGHSRNLSASSVGSDTSSGGMADDNRRRPQPLAMANDPAARARPTLDTYNTSINGSPGQQYSYYNQSPSTPTSITFSNGPASPQFGSNMASPSSSLSRSSFYNGARHAPGQRRLSVPSAAHPYQNMGGTAYPPVYFSPIPSGTSTTFSQSGSMFGSPTSSVFSHGRRDSEAELEYRRRTWHPGTYPGYSQRPATSGLSYQQTPDDHRPAPSGQLAASQVTRLPGIESFDHAPPTNARQQPSPMMTDVRPSSSHRASDAGLHQGITRLDIAAANAPVEGHWQATQPATSGQPGYFSQQQPGTVAPQFIHHQHSASMPEPFTPRKHKRQGWYGGPVQAHQPNSVSNRPSPEDSGSSDGVSTPSASQGTEYHPVIINPTGVVETYPPGGALTEEQKVQHANTPRPLRADSGFQSYNQLGLQHTYALQAGHDPRYPPNYQPSSNNDMGRLEALVAVATSENRAVEHRS